MQRDYLLQALDLARPRLGFCAPNPAVGAIIVKNQQVIGSGSHFACGEPHAEVKALEQAGSAAAGATIYITLEPCCHQGRTPPCTTALLEYGISEVVYAFQDPNPQMAGKGAALLQQQGVSVQHVTVPEIDEFYQAYSHWTLTKLPSLTAKIALSLDGKIAGVNSEPLAITDQSANEFTHQQRLHSDCLLTTSKTILNDDPSMNARITAEIISKPIFILDRNLTTPLDAKIFTTTSQQYFFHQADVAPETKQALENLGATCIEVPVENAKLSLPHVIQAIGEFGMHKVWIEVGGTCLQQLIQANLLKKLYIYIAAKTYGNSFTAAFDQQLDLAQTAKDISWSNLGNDGLCEVNY